MDACLYSKYKVSIKSIKLNIINSLIKVLYRVRHKSVNTPLSHERLVGGLQDGGRGTHVTHFVQLYPQPLYTYCEPGAYDKPFVG